MHTVAEKYIGPSTWALNGNSECPIGQRGTQEAPSWSRTSRTADNERTVRIEAVPSSDDNSTERLRFRVDQESVFLGGGCLRWGPSIL